MWNPISRDHWFVPRRDDDIINYFSVSMVQFCFFFTEHRRGDAGLCRPEEIFLWSDSCPCNICLMAPMSPKRRAGVPKVKVENIRMPLGFQFQILPSGFYKPVLWLDMASRQQRFKIIYILHINSQGTIQLSLNFSWCLWNISILLKQSWWQRNTH